MSNKSRDKLADIAKEKLACGGIVKNFKCDYFISGDHYEDWFYPTDKTKSIFNNKSDNVDKNINIVINMKSTFGGIDNVD